MKFELFSRVALATDMPQYRLKKGDVATVVDYLIAEDNGDAGYALEVFNAVGETIDVIDAAEADLEPLRPDGILNARHLVGACVPCISPAALRSAAADGTRPKNPKAPALSPPRGRQFFRNFAF